MGIRVVTDIPFGNACDVQVHEDDGRPEVSFAADPHGGPECLWFCFRLKREGSGPGVGSPIRLVLKHTRSMLGVTAPFGVRPVVRPAGGDWERLGEPEVEELPDGRRRISWNIETPRDFADVAYCYPYGRDELTSLIRETEGYWRVDTIGVSQQARPLLRLSNNCGAEGSDRPGLYVIARQHSGETPGSWVLDGFLRHIATLGDEAPVVWAVPLSNIDGVEQGDYGKDNFPYDLNRAWGNAPMRHEVLVCRRDVLRWKERCRPVLGIDSHAPGGAEREGVYAFMPDPAEFAEMNNRIETWTEAVVESLTPVYAAEKFSRIADYPSRWQTPNFGRFFYETLGVPALSLETPYGMIGELVLTREHYREIGKRIAQGVLHRIAEL